MRLGVGDAVNEGEQADGPREEAREVQAPGLAEADVRQQAQGQDGGRDRDHEVHVKAPAP